MNRPQSLIHIVAPHPDGRKREMLVTSCLSQEDVQQKVIQLGLDVDTLRVFSGHELPVRKQVLVMLGDPRPRRGRPLGSKNKKKRKQKPAKNELASRIKRKSAKRAKASAAAAVSVSPRRGKRAGETQAERNARVEATA